MVHFEQTWRWFGPNDRITLDQIRQTGVTGIVTALHQIKVGDLWTLEKVEERQKMIEAHGLKWTVVESVPVSEDIKKQTGNYLQHIENYKQTLINLGKCGIKTVCYNFMPILDWSRTNVVNKKDDGSESLKYEYHKFAAFDICILKRPNAENEYPAEVAKQGINWYNNASQPERDSLKAAILMGLPGSLEAYTLEELTAKLKEYAHIDKAKLRQHMDYFLQQVVPAAEQADVKLAVHPDDPPWPLLGLPRIVSSVDDLEHLTSVVPSPYNGITLCTGSLGAGHFNNLSGIAEKLAEKVNFAHLRNVKRNTDLNFEEDNFFDGDVNMVEVTTTLLKEMVKRKNSGDKRWQIPMRPDHGFQMLGDLGLDNYPGYSLYGRMKSLAEFRGLEIGLLTSLKR